jgi:hypothetical protein
MSSKRKEKVAESLFWDLQNLQDIGWFCYFVRLATLKSIL